MQNVLCAGKFIQPDGIFCHAVLINDPFKQFNVFKNIKIVFLSKHVVL